MFFVGDDTLTTIASGDLVGQQDSPFRSIQEMGQFIPMAPYFLNRRSKDTGSSACMALHLSFMGVDNEWKEGGTTFTQI